MDRAHDRDAADRRSDADDHQRLTGARSGDRRHRGHDPRHQLPRNDDRRVRRTGRRRRCNARCDHDRSRRRRPGLAWVRSACQVINPGKPPATLAERPSPTTRSQPFLAIDFIARRSATASPPASPGRCATWAGRRCPARRRRIRTSAIRGGSRRCCGAVPERRLIQVQAAGVPANARPRRACRARRARVRSRLPVTLSSGARSRGHSPGRQRSERRDPDRHDHRRPAEHGRDGAERRQAGDHLHAAAGEARTRSRGMYKADPARIAALNAAIESLTNELNSVRARRHDRRVRRGLRSRCSASTACTRTRPAISAWPKRSATRSSTRFEVRP